MILEKALECGTVDLSLLPTETQPADLLKDRTAFVEQIGSGEHHPNKSCVLLNDPPFDTALT